MPDRSVLLAVAVLGLVVIICMIGGIVCVLNDKAMPDALIAIGSSAGTAIALVISRPLGGTQNVRVVDQPVEVEPADGG